MSALSVVHVVEALGMGGLERVVHSLVRHAPSARFSVRVVCAVAGGPLAADIERLGAPVEIAGVSGYYPGAILAFARRLRSLAPDVVHCHGHFAGVLGRAAAWWAGVPILIHHLHTLDASLAPRHCRLERALARVSARILCCSSAVARHAAEAIGIPASRTLVIPNGIDPPPDTDRRAALELLGHPTPPVVGCVGALRPHKGQAVLLRALARAGGSGSVVLIGEGPERDALERLARDAPAWRLILPGARADARRLIPAFDVAVVPSIAREGFGLAAIEAMDAALPVIASRVGGLPEVIEHGLSGVLVPPGDEAALGAALRDLLDHPRRGRALGMAARLRVETRFRAAAMARRVAEAYEEAADARRAA